MDLKHLKSQYKDTFVLAEVTHTNDLGQATEVKPLASSKDRNYLARRAQSLASSSDEKSKPTRLTILFTGKQEQKIRI